VFFVAAVLAQLSVTQITPTQSSGQTYLVRFETAVSPAGATFNTAAIGGQVTATNANNIGPVTLFFRDLSSANSVITPAAPFGGFLPSNGFPSDGADAYVAVSVLAGAGGTPNLVLCLNNTVLFPFVDLCTLPFSLLPIGGSGGLINRATVTLTQQFISNPASTQLCDLSTGTVTGQCTVTSQTIPTLLSNGFGQQLSVVNEQLNTARDCNLEPVFGRGTLTCPVLLGRTLVTGETAFVNAVGGTGSGVLTPASLSGSSLNNPLFEVPRTGGLEFASPGAGNLAGGAVGDQSRAIESFFTPASVASVSYDTFYVAVINVAHLETTSVVNGVTLFTPESATATVVIEDGVGRVLQYQLSLPQEASAGQLDSRFVELYVTQSPMTINVQAVPELLGFNNIAFNGSLAGNSVVVSQSGFFTVQPNGFYVIALSTFSNPTVNQYDVKIFDVTPSNGILQNTEEQQIINLIEPNFDLELFQVTNTAGSTTCSPVGTVVASDNSAVLFNGSITNIVAAPLGAACPAPTAFLSGLNIGGSTFPGNTLCGHHVTIFFGRTYTLNTTTCLGTALTTVVGDLTFAGSTFTTLQNGAPLPLTFTLGACNCTAPSIVQPCDTCTASILTAITGSSGSVSGSVSGLSGSINSVLSSVGGVAGTLANVEQRLTRMNSTLHFVKSLDTKIQKLVKHKC